MISFEIGYEGEIKWDNSKPDGTPRKLLDISKATTLGWTAKTSLKKGIKLTISHYMNELNSKSIRLQYEIVKNKFDFLNLSRKILIDCLKINKRRSKQKKIIFTSFIYAIIQNALF